MWKSPLKPPWASKKFPDHPWENPDGKSGKFYRHFHPSTPGGKGGCGKRKTMGKTGTLWKPNATSKRKSFFGRFFTKKRWGAGVKPRLASRRTRNPHATGSAGRAEKTSRWDVFSRGTLAPPTPKEINKRFFPCFRRSKGYWSCRFLIISSTISLSWELFFSLRSISCMA